MLKMTDLEEFIETFRKQINRINPETDVMWTRYNSPEEAKASLIQELNELKNGNMNKLFSLHAHFSTTSTFQELSIQNNWREECLDIATRMDKLYMRLKPKDKKKLLPCANI